MSLYCCFVAACGSVRSGAHTPPPPSLTEKARQQDNLSLVKLVEELEGDAHCEYK